MSVVSDGGAAVRYFCTLSAAGASALTLLVASAACSDEGVDPDPFAAAGAGGSTASGLPPTGASGNGATPGVAGSNGLGGSAPAATDDPIPGAGGGTPGAAGAAAAPPAAGSGGAAPTQPSAGAGGTMLVPAQPIGEADPPSLPGTECPVGATFCSGFEEPALPSGARFDANPTTALAFDGTVFNSGGQSLAFPAIPDGFSIREVVAPIPGSTFWVRLFMRSDTVFGDNDHDSVFVASTTLGDNNSEDGVEFSEQGNQVLLNSNDQLFSAAGAGFPMGAGPTLEANTWHCLEGFFDGPSGDVQIFADGELLIDAPGYRQVTYQTFRFGYLQFPGGNPRSVWFDDVIVSSARVGCD